MANDIAAQKVLDAAYSFLALRSHSRMELKTKLVRKGFPADLIENTINILCRQGYLNEKDISLGWAQSLVKNRMWGKTKITHYLIQKGISRDIIDNVQRKLWCEFDEAAIAGKALNKKFSSCDIPPSVVKQASFLKSRGFSSDVIYKVVSGLSEEF